MKHCSCLWRTFLILACLVCVSPKNAYAVEKVNCADLLMFDDGLRKQILNSFINLSKAKGQTASLPAVLFDLHLDPRDEKKVVGPKGFFKSWQDLKNEAMARKPGAFKFVVDTDVFNSEKNTALLQAIKTHRRMIVTTAVAGSPVNRDFLAALKNYAKRMDAEIIVYPANMQTTGLDPVLLESPGVHILTNTTELTPHLTLNRIQLTAKQINPLMGLDRLGNRGQSQIVGSPKMHSKTIATIKNTYFPHRLWTTGAITDPLYAGEKYISGRTDEIAEHDHVMGAVILEKTSNDSQFLPDLGRTGEFHVRHIEYIPEKQGFTDLDTFFTDKTAKRVSPIAVVLGDTHVGDHDEKLMDAIGKLLDKNPEYVVLHDFLNGKSVNHHNQDRLLTLAEAAEKGELNVEAEFKYATSFLNAILARNPKVKIVIPQANHPLWVTGWLQSGQFMREPENMGFGLKLADQFKNGRDPVEYAVLEREGTRVDYPNRVLFLPLGSDFPIGPENRMVQLALHGHSGSNGSRGGLASFARGNDRIVFGHTHSVGRLNGAVNVGTNTQLVLPYNKDGMSSWVQGAAMVGQDGQIQVLEFQNGEWYADATSSVAAPEDFFGPNYPKVKANKIAPSQSGQIDQWGVRR